MQPNHQPSQDGDPSAVLVIVRQFIDEFEECFSMEHIASAGDLLGQIADHFPALLEAKEAAAEAIRRQQEGGAE